MKGRRQHTHYLCVIDYICTYYYTHCLGVIKQQHFSDLIFWTKIKQKHLIRFHQTDVIHYIYHYSEEFHHYLSLFLIFHFLAYGLSVGGIGSVTAAPVTVPALASICASATPAKASTSTFRTSDPSRLSHQRRHLSLLIAWYNSVDSPSPSGRLPLDHKGGLILD